MRKQLLEFRFTLLAWIIAMAFTMVTVWFVGESPVNVLKILFHSSFGSFQEGTVAENLSYTLYYATPMILTAASVTVALEAGLFNIGAEGQLYIGALFASVVGILAKNYVTGYFTATFVFLFALSASFVGGAAWGGIAGYLKTRRQTHEVIATILLNFIAYALCNWAILNLLKNPDTQNLETIAIAQTYRLPRLWGHMTYGFPFALLVSFFALWSLRRTWWGFRVRATGLNASASDLAGIKTSQIGFMTMAIAGGIAGLVGFQEVFLNSYKLHDSFSPGFGFTGLAIALLSRGNIFNLWFCAFIFGALHKGTLDLDLETDKITRDLSAVIQALVLVALAAQPALKSLFSKLLSARSEKKHG